MANDEDILRDYRDSIERLRNECISNGIPEEEFDETYQNVVNSFIKDESSRTGHRNRLRFYGIIGVITAIILFYYSSFHTCLLCNLQEYIYPGLKLIRRISIPFISLFPSLTGWYHETCLIQNPFFSVTDMDCWPCSMVTNVQSVNDPGPVTEQPVAPFTYQSSQKVVTVSKLNQFYLENLAEFDKESIVFKNNNINKLSKAQEMFKQLKDGEKDLYVWKFNTMNGAKLLRKLIQRPVVVPKFGQSTERFIIIDSSLATFQVPDTECSNSFLLVLSGSREVMLKPADECKHQCNHLNVELKDTFLLWYNWWYWRPVIQSTNGNGTLVAHVGSYC